MTQLFPHGVVTDADSVTGVVLKAMSRTPDARLREIMASLVRHLHAFAREVKLTDDEFEKAVDFMVRLGQSSGDMKNEVVLASDLVGFSTLVCLLNNPSGAGETDSALLGPFWRANAPACKPGESIARDHKGGEPLEVRGEVVDIDGRPIAGVIVDVWQASPVGLYENQDPDQPDHNLRGRFETDAQGRFHLRTVRPKGYPVPTDGPCGELLRAQVRHPYRPAHLHFLLSKEGYKTLVTQVFDDIDECLASDVVFGVVSSLSRTFERQPDGSLHLDHRFVMRPGASRIPRPPIP